MLANNPHQTLRTYSMVQKQTNVRNFFLTDIVRTGQFQKPL